MGWYYYSGEAPAPVPTGGGEVVAVRPYTKVFIAPDAETTAEVRRLLAMGRLCVTSWPKGQKPVKADIDLDKKVQMGSTKFAEAIVENPPAKVSVAADVVEVDESSVDGKDQKSGTSKRRSSLKKKAAKLKSKQKTASTSSAKGSEKANTEGA
jgi:hypothetical protein